MAETVLACVAVGAVAYLVGFWHGGKFGVATASATFTRAIDRAFEENGKRADDGSRAG